MEVQKIFDMTVTLMFGEAVDQVDYEPFWMDTLNFLIAENFKKNNVLRVMRGKEALREMPWMAAMDDELEYEDEFTRHILPIGCAGYIYTDDDRGIGAAFKDKYEYERSQVLGAVYEPEEHEE